jgi:phytoene desaturase
MQTIVIGSGFGGLTTAILLQANGYSVTLVEKLDQLGGRGRAYIFNGYDFEAGPTVITAPALLEELYSRSGLDFKSEVQLIETTPFYELYFHDGSKMKYFGDQDKLIEEIKKINPKDVAGYHKFFKKSTKIYQKGFVELVKHPFLSYLDFFKQLPNLIRLQAQRSVYSLTKTCFQDERLRRVFSFHTLLIGGNPKTTTSIYALIHALERNEGVWYVKGGTHALINNLAKNFEKFGGKIIKGIGVAEIKVENQQVSGVKLENGEILPAEIVVSNADITRTYTRYLSDDIKKDYSQKWFNKKKYTPGLFVTYFVTNKEYPELSHHNVIFCERYIELLRDIFEPNNILTEDFSLYLHANKRSDPDRAPPGKDMFYVLSVVPNLKSGTDWNSFKEKYQQIILSELNERVIPNLFDNLDFAVSFTPADFDTVLQSEWGSFASLQPTLFQSGPFRPHNKSHKIKGLYFAGAGTQPGAGVPGVISSGIITTDLILKDKPVVL